MRNDEKHAREVDENRRRQIYREQVRQMGASLDDQNARLERLIKNYRLNRTWNRIMKWVQFKEWVKSVKNAVVAKMKKLNPMKKQPKTTQP